MYFVMTQTKESSFEVHPVQDWCVFKKKITHRTLTDEEAEKEWNSRNKLVKNLFLFLRSLTNLYLMCIKFRKIKYLQSIIK